MLLQRLRTTFILLLQCFRTSNNFDEFSCNRRLTRTVILNGKPVDHVARVARCVVHSRHFRTLLRRCIFTVRTQQLNRNVARQQVGEDFFLIGFIFNRSTYAWHSAIGCNRYRHQLDGRGLLSQYGDEFRKQQMRNVKFGRLETRGQVFAPALHVSEGQFAKIARLNAVDDVVTIRTGELVLALLTDRVEFDGLASAAQFFCFLTRQTNDVGVECTRQTLV